jgi:hypothetical protein
VDIYAEIDQRRAERAARRQARLEREARRERIIAPVRFVAQVIGGAILLYLYLFVGCLWASM